jgi:2'-5' RNA ligase
MSDLTAVDVLIDPDDQAIERARTINARLLKSLPEGWALDDTHKPHITTLQRYVRTADLDKVYEAVEKILSATEMSSLGYQAVKITHADWGFPGYGPTVLLVQVSPEVLAFQAKLEAAVAPFVESGGTAEAFVADPGEVISPTIIKWVEGYVPDQIGDGKYLPHLTVGAGKFDDLKIIEAEPFDAFAVHPSGVAVYHLGNNGTARKLLKAWPVKNS